MRTTQETSSEIKSIGKFCILKMKYIGGVSPGDGDIDSYNQLLLKEEYIWNLLIAKTILKVFLVEPICGFRVLVMPYLFPLSRLLKSMEEYKDMYEPQIRAQIEVMWEGGWMHGDSSLRHVGLWKCGEQLKVQLFDFGHATRITGKRWLISKAC